MLAYVVPANNTRLGCERDADPRDFPTDDVGEPPPSPPSSGPAPPSSPDQNDSGLLKYFLRRLSHKSPPPSVWLVAGSWE
jgi:hypothetical protein